MATGLAKTDDAQANLPAPRPQPTDDDMAVAWQAARNNVSVNTDDVPPITKAAIVLSALGPEVAAGFLKNMNEGALPRTAIAISRLDRIPPEMLDAVIAEFLLSIGTEEEISGGSQTARRLLAEVLDDTTIDRIMFDVEGGDTRKAWKKLNDISNNALATFVGAEHPQTAAVILDPDVAEMGETVIARDFLSALQRTKRSRRPADLIAGLMNNLQSDNREKFLEFLEGEKPSLHSDVLKTMFTFNDIRHRVEAREVAIIVK